MAVITKNAKAAIRLNDVQGKLLCSYSGVYPQIAANKVMAFAEGINTLRKDNARYTYLVTEAELEQTEEA